MAGQLFQVATTTITSATASMSITGIDTDDVYVLAFSNIRSSVDSATGLYLRFTESGSPNTNANYDYADKDLRCSEAFGIDYAVDQTVLSLAWATGNATGEEDGGILTIFNANNSSAYTMMQYESYYMVSTPKLRGRQGGLVLTENTEVDGIHLYWSHGDITSGTFTLYRQV